jgi:hypothetical protein
MKVAFLCAVLFCAVSPTGGSAMPRVPVLLELFTSEGCSSCPPADRLLRRLDSEQPVPGAELVVLSEHVDYWNRLGWKDPFSSAQFSERQSGYARILGGQDVYTPELIVDGAKGFTGSDVDAARRAIHEALAFSKMPIRVDVQRAEGKAKISIHMDHAAEGTLFLALAHDAMTSQVTRGENAGRDLAHVAVVYSLEKIGRLDRKTTVFDHEVTVTLRPGETTRVVAFVAKPEAGEAGRVVAVGQARL